MALDAHLMATWSPAAFSSVANIPFFFFFNLHNFYGGMSKLSYLSDCV